jgi:hypothetical protein
VSHPVFERRGDDACDVDVPVADAALVARCGADVEGARWLRVPAGRRVAACCASRVRDASRAGWFGDLFASVRLVADPMTAAARALRAAAPGNDGEFDGFGADEAVLVVRRDAGMPSEEPVFTISVVSQMGGLRGR